MIPSGLNIAISSSFQLSAKDKDYRQKIWNSSHLQNDIFVILSEAKNLVISGS